MVVAQRYHKRRRFSALGKLQAKSEILYRVDCLPGEVAVYRAVLIKADGVQRDSLRIEDVSPSEARMILDFLWENAVPFCHWKEVLCDAVANI